MFTFYSCTHFQSVLTYVNIHGCPKSKPLAIFKRSVLKTDCVIRAAIRSRIHCDSKNWQVYSTIYDNFRRIAL